MSNVKTRFAPSPTGRMHVGNLRTALYAYLIAKHDDGTFMLRIEDTDQERFQEGALDIIYRTLKETGLVHDEGPDKDGGCGPYVQSERNAAGLYLKYAKQLVEQGDAYYCFCDAERLSQCKRNVGGKEISIYDKHCLGLSKEEVEANLAAGKPYVIRFNMPTEGTTTFHDEIYGDITVNNEELEDLILIKSDGYPTYNFANVIDDHLMGVTHVVRGNEYLSSSPKYNRIYEAFGWKVPVYVHCPLITNEEHQKLSKRCGHSSYEDLIDQGFLKDAIVNFVALLGWSPEGNREIYSLEELVKIFDYHHISKSPAVFDMTKLRWMNGEYMKAMDDEKFYEMALPYIQKTIHRPLDFKKIAAMVKTRIEVFPDIAVFFLSGCLPRPRVLPSGVAAGSARTLRSVLPLKVQAQPPAPVLLLCFLPLPLQLPIPLPPFSNPQPFFLPSSAPVSFSAVLLFLSFSSSSVPRHFPCCNRS